jgi:hypothetical protein
MLRLAWGRQRTAKGKLILLNEMPGSRLRGIERLRMRWCASWFVFAGVELHCAVLAGKYSDIIWETFTNQGAGMSTQPTLTEILPRIDQAIQQLIQMVKLMPPAMLVEPRLGEGRSVKDVLAHLTWWDRWLLLTLPPVPGAPALTMTLPLADQIPATNAWADEMNAKVLEYNQPREFAEIWEELTCTCAVLLQRVAQLTDADLYDPTGLAAEIGQPVAPLICGIYEHYEEHGFEFAQIDK